MVSTGLLVTILLLQAGVLIGTLAAFLLHGVWLSWYRRWSQPLVTDARTALVEALVSTPTVSDVEVAPVLSSEQLQHARRLPMSLQVRLLHDLARNLKGVGRLQLALVAEDLGLLFHAEFQCRSRFWWRRLQGARLLALIGTGDEVMPSLLHDPEPVVRAQVADWATSHPVPEVIAGLFELLEDDESFSRFAVQDALLRMGGFSVEPLIRYIYSHSGRSVEAALVVAIGLADSRFLPAALLRCRDASPEVRALAATLVGALGGTEGVEVLIKLLGDPAAQVRAAAARALGKLAHWRAAPTLVTLLRDPYWIVRREAGLALRALGAPGILFLRRALSDRDPFAADMAHQVLDLPETAGSAMSMAR